MQPISNMKRMVLWGTSPFSPSMSERSELRSRREERMENGVKNLKGARLYPKTFVLNIATSYHGNGDAYIREDGILKYFYFILLTFFVFLITI